MFIAKVGELMCETQLGAHRNRLRTEDEIM
jgi:hypothetical protein